MNPQLTACLLAGGKSSRMGRDKAGVEFAGVPLWEHQVRTLRKAAPEEILISGRRDACYGASGIPIIEDAIKESGPLAGVAALLSAASFPLVLILAVDMPFVTGEYLRSLRGQCSPETGAVAERSGFFEGLAAIFPKRAAPLAARALQGGDHSMQNFVRECVAAAMMNIVKSGDGEEALFRSLNSAADLASVTL